MKLKKSFMIFSMLISTGALAADWTPVFKSFENGCSDSKLLQNILNKGVWSAHPTTPNTFVRPTALKGNYANVISPYRNDMQAAKSKLYQEGEEYIEVTIPLKNATLYGVPVKAFTAYSGTASGLAGRSVIFSKPSAAQLQRLQSIKFKADPEQDFKGGITRNDQGETILLCDLSM